MQLFRSMTEATDGFPETGPSARLLGVRPGNTTMPDVAAVNPNDLVYPGAGGMSVAPHDPMHLLKHRRPASLGGTGHDPVWLIDSEDLDPDLQFHQDSASHGVIEPSRPITLREFQDALARSRSRWKLCCR